MHKEDKNRILQKTKDIEDYLGELKSILPSKSEYMKSLIIRRACEKTIELAIQATIDIAGMAVSYDKLGIPTEESDIFEILEKNRAISNKTVHNLRQIKGFRNIIIHKYGEVDNEMAYTYLSNKTTDFYIFINEIKKYLSGKRKPKRKASQ